MNRGRVIRLAAVVGPVLLTGMSGCAAPELNRFGVISPSQQVRVELAEPVDVVSRYSRGRTIVHQDAVRLPDPL